MTENPDEVQHTLNRSINRINGWISLGVICLILILQPIVKRSWKDAHQRRYRKDSAFYWTLMSVYVVHAIHQLVLLALDYAWQGCGACISLNLTTALIFVVTRITTYFFILQVLFFLAL